MDQYDDDFPATDSRPLLEEVRSDLGDVAAGRVPTNALRAELARQAESDALVESFVADGDTDPDSVAAKVYAELRYRDEGVATFVGPSDRTRIVTAITQIEDVADESLRDVLARARREIRRVLAAIDDGEV